MKIGVLGDLHLRTEAPAGRTGDGVPFHEVCLGKLGQAFSIFRENNCGCVIQPGDFFDSPTPPLWFVARVIEELRAYTEDHEGLDDDDKERYAIEFVVVHGQHDLRYHADADKKDSVLTVMEAAQVLNVLWQEEPYQSEDAEIQGASYGEEPVRPRTKFDVMPILVCHAMVGDKPLFAGQKITAPEAFMRQHKGYQVYVFGDYHYPFVIRADGCVAVNAGALLRLRRNARELKLRPGVLIIDTDTLEVQRIELSVKPAEEVFAEPVKRKVTDESAAKKLIAKLGKGMKGKLDFSENLLAYFKEHKTPKPVREIVLEELEHG